MDISYWLFPLSLLLLGALGMINNTLKKILRALEAQAYQEKKSSPLFGNSDGEAEPKMKNYIHTLSQLSVEDSVIHSEAEESDQLQNLIKNLPKR